jgi:hypothetical protein
MNPAVLPVMYVRRKAQLRQAQQQLQQRDQQLAAASGETAFKQWVVQLLRCSLALQCVFAACCFQAPDSGLGERGGRRQRA